MRICGSPQCIRRRLAIREPHWEATGPVLLLWPAFRDPADRGRKVGRLYQRRSCIWSRVSLGALAGSGFDFIRATSSSMALARAAGSVMVGGMIRGEVAVSSGSDVALPMTSLNLSARVGGTGEIGSIRT